MKVKELIEQLNFLDPEGNTDILINGEKIRHIFVQYSQTYCTNKETHSLIITNKNTISISGDRKSDLIRRFYPNILIDIDDDTYAKNDIITYIADILDISVEQVKKDIEKNDPSNVKHKKKETKFPGLSEVIKTAILNEKLVIEDIPKPIYNMYKSKKLK